MPVALVPLVLVAMNLIYSLSAYPLGKLSDRMSHRKLLGFGLVVLIAADLVLATNDQWGVVLVGAALWAYTWGSLKHYSRRWSPTPHPPICAVRPMAPST